VLEKTLLDYERNGLGLSADKRQEFKAIKKEISELCIQFQKHLNEDTTKLEFTRKQLTGLPDSFFDGLPKVSTTTTTTTTAAAAAATWSCDCIIA
jgi:Zn-dependent oligopeptidase